MKKEIYISILLVFLLIPIALFIYIKSISTEEVEGEVIESRITTYAVSDVTDVKDILWKDSTNLLLQTKDKIYSHNTNIRESTELATIGLNTKLGINNDEVLICTWENTTIYSTEEFATTISIYNLKDKKLWEEEFHETMKVEVCSLENIIAKTAFEFMQEKYYSISIRTKSIIETEYIKDEIKLLETITTTPIHISGFNKNRIGIIDNLGTVWIQLLKN